MSHLEIGWSRRDISTDEPVPIIGQAHLRISDHCEDPLTLTALALREEGTVIFLSVDATEITSTLYRMILEKVRKKNPAVPTDAIIVNATHTHTAGGFVRGCGWFSYEERAETDEENVDTVPDPLSYYPIEKYREFLAENAADAICEAYENMTDGAVAFGYGSEVLGYSRRVVYEDKGIAQMYGETNDPAFSGFEGGVDNKVNLLYTFDRNGTLTGAIVNIPCPSQCSENEWFLSADFWHETRELIRAEYGDIFILPQCAAAGDAAPAVLYYKEAHARRLRAMYPDAKYPARMEIAARIFHAFSETLAWCRSDLRRSMPIAHKVETVFLSKRLVTEEEKAEYEKILEKTRETPFIKEGLSQKERWVENTYRVGKIAQCHMILERYEEDRVSDKFPMEMHTVRMGEIAFATSCFELYTDYMHRIQARAPFTQTFVLQLCGIPQKNGGIYYLANRRAMEKGGYSAYLFSNIISAEGGQELVEATLASLSELHERK